MVTQSSGREVGAQRCSHGWATQREECAYHLNFDELERPWGKPCGSRLWLYVLYVSWTDAKIVPSSPDPGAARFELTDPRGA